MKSMGMRAYNGGYGRVWEAVKHYTINNCVSLTYNRTGRKCGKGSTIPTPVQE